MKFFLSNFKPKGIPSPEKDVSQKIVRKFIPKWKLGRKWLMHDANKGMGCFLGYMRKIGHLLSVMEDMESSNEGSLSIVG